MLVDNIAGDGGLECPHCLNNYLHHDKVEVFSRRCEDQEGIRSVTLEAGRAFVDIDMRDNPSRRRDGLLVHFWCETCDKRSALSISQHKGSTYMAWVDVSLPVTP